jgi:hypothetical protein
MRDEFERLRDDAEGIGNNYSELEEGVWLNRVDTLTIFAIRVYRFNKRLENDYVKFDNCVDKDQKIIFGKKLLDSIIGYANSQLSS